MSLEEIRSFVSGHGWTFASTMPKFPHEYTLRRNARDQGEFNRFVMHIRKRGHPKRFFRKTFIYLEVDGYSYWTMGSPLDETILINRAKTAT